MRDLIIPRPIAAGDTIAIVSPASIIDPAYVDGARRALESCGFNVRVMPHALDRCGNMAGSRTARLEDLSAALTDPEVAAVLCSRGGYGCVQLLDDLARLPLEASPKWLIGFSDVSALHALMASKGIVSIHGSMAKALATRPLDDESNRRLLDILSGRCEPLSWQLQEHSDTSSANTAYAIPNNHPGEASGRLLGGNLAVIQALMSTPFSPMADGAILFVEDIAEPIYKINRIFYQLKLSGVLDRIAGLVIGQFTDYRPDANFSSVEAMLSEVLNQWNPAIPIAFNAPVGHVDYNRPLLHNTPVSLSVTPSSGTIAYNL